MPNQPRRALPRLRHPSDHPLMTVSQVAKRLGYSEMTIRRRISARQFPAVRIGRKSMVPRAFVERLVALAEAGQTVVVDEVVEAWQRESSSEESGPGGIAARRGPASEVPGEDASTRVQGRGWTA